MTKSGKGSGNGTPQPAAYLPFFSPLAAHHSAKRVIVERNLPICDLQGCSSRLRLVRDSVELAINISIITQFFYAFF